MESQTVMVEGVLTRRTRWNISEHDALKVSVLSVYPVSLAMLNCFSPKTKVRNFLDTTGTVCWGYSLLGKVCLLALNSLQMDTEKR